jgi:formylglycine-generating enzyme required for sulfatase activity
VLPLEAPTEPVAEAPTDTPVVPPTPVGPPTEPPPTLRDRLRDGSTGPTMVVLQGGAFRMGQNSLAGADTGPEHEVRLDPFLIGSTEVTFQQYDRFVRATGRRFPDDFGWGRANRPVVGVSWSEAQAYADWLTRQTGKRYRLPSEAEWEFAAQAGTRSPFPWGFALEPGRAACFDCRTQWDNRSTAPVGSFAPNAYGLYDTAGNAAEWVADCYAPGYDGAPADGRPRADGNCTNRVARGGAFNKPSSSIKTYARAKFVPETQLSSVGFRVAREP